MNSERFMVCIELTLLNYNYISRLQLFCSLLEHSKHTRSTSINANGNFVSNFCHITWNSW